MKRHLAIAAAAIASLLSVAGSEILGCEWAIDYFYQVTNLRGTVVGSDFPVLHSFRWYRQFVVRPQAKLMLYEFCWPCDALSRAPGQNRCRKFQRRTRVHLEREINLG